MLGATSALLLVCGLQRAAYGTPPSAWWVAALSVLALGTACTNAPLKAFVCVHWCSLAAVHWLGLDVQWVLPLLGTGCLVVTKSRALEACGLPRADIFG